MNKDKEEQLMKSCTIFFINPSLNLKKFVICLSTKDGQCVLFPHETVGYDTALLCYYHMFNPYLVPFSSSLSNSFGICKKSFFYQFIQKHHQPRERIDQWLDIASKRFKDVSENLS